MFKRLLISFLATTVLAGCSGYKMGDVLANPGDINQRQTANETIALKVVSQNQWDLAQCRNLSRVASQVFSQYGWRVRENAQAPLTVEMTVDTDNYIYPEFTLLYFAGIGTLPAKFENYYTVEARISIDGVECDRVLYTGNSTEYMTCYGPIGLLMPGVTHREFASPMTPDDLQNQIYRRLMQHVAEDIRAKYFSGNYQKTAV